MKISILLLLAAVYYVTAIPLPRLPEIKTSKNAKEALEKVVEFYNLPSSQQYLNNFYDKLKTTGTSIQSWVFDFIAAANNVVTNDEDVKDVVQLLDQFSDNLKAYGPVAEFLFNYAKSLLDILAPEQGPKGLNDILVGKREDDNDEDDDIFGIQFANGDGVEVLKKILEAYENPWAQLYINAFYYNFFVNSQESINEWVKKFLANADKVINENASPKDIVEQLQPLTKAFEDGRKYYDDTLRAIRILRKQLLEKATLEYVL